ncbi:prefoldin, alpha subunit [Acanthamoeba castellanii str. Neff]|uniref:Prefoldin, alpha subunit n=1 Tax=Acanthamoeba castellanii (strain ATCC 30010 / Neff) TaxID=1257118 RepID=L8HDI9_ACACF|nr:prefoldin, alpha subunit [Acanthamoeba castellanii str. Neff]ELR22828.1 prefoldin, alpha subunit [Acanthamoeba castellanii str. Neff]
MAAPGGQQGQPIPITSLSLEQLSNLKQQFEEEAQTLAASLQKLKTAGQRFLDSKDSLAALTPETNGREVLAPLTSSLYVKGKLTNVEAVMIDIGTGYYIERTPQQAQEYVDRKLGLVQENAEKLQQALLTKRKNLEAIIGVMQEKMAQQPQ